MPSDLHRVFTYYRIRTVVVPHVPPDTLDVPSIFRQGRIMAYLTLAQFCQRIAKPDEEATKAMGMEDQLKEVEDGLSPERFFDVPTLLKQCSFGRWGPSEYTAVGDMLVRVLRAMRPVKTDREGFLLFCEEVCVWQKYPPLLSHSQCALPVLSAHARLTQAQLAWVKVSFIRRQQFIKGPFPRRQDLKDSDVVVGRPPLGRRLYCLSHQWDSEFHPNPSGDKMRRLAIILDRLQADDNDLLFVDFCSLPQVGRDVPDDYFLENDLMMDRQAERSHDETDRFRFCMWEMSRLYGFHECHVIVLPQSSRDFPGGENAWGRVSNDPYHNRGWCASEYSIARSNGRICNRSDDPRDPVLHVESKRPWPDTPYEYVDMMKERWDGGELKVNFTKKGDRSVVAYNFFKSCFGLTHSFFSEVTYDDYLGVPSPPVSIEGPVEQSDMPSKMYAYVCLEGSLQQSLRGICDGLLGRNNLPSRSEEWRARQQWPLMLVDADADHLTRTLTGGHAHCLVLFASGWDGLLDTVEALLPTLAHPPSAILLCMRFGAREAAKRLSHIATVVWIRTDTFDATNVRNVFFGMVGPILHALHSRPRKAQEVTDLVLRTGRSILGPRWEGAGCLRQLSSPLVWPPSVGEFTIHTRITTAAPSTHVEALQISAVGINLLDRFPSQTLIDAVQACLPTGSEVVALYRDDPFTGMVPIQVCVRIVSIAFLHELRDAVLMGRLEEGMKQRLKVTVVVDKSSFANVYEASVLKLDTLTPHQEERLADSRGERDVHLKAPAGGGKTYVALHRMLEVLEEGNQRGMVLFVAKNRALSHLICTWICKRLADRPMQRLAVLSRLYLLFDPVEEGPREVTLLEGHLTFALSSEARDFTMVVVDEAHHVYSDPRLRAKAEQYVTEGITQRLLLSDVSQSYGNGVAFPTGMRDVFLEEVVRSSMRIVQGAMAFQLGDKVTVRCHHSSNGPPLKSLLFQVDGDRFACYARELRRALELVLDEFRSLHLHNRLVILVPDADFLSLLREPLERELRSLSDRSFEIVTARKASAALLTGSRESEREWLILDEVAEFDGLERLIVIGVGLDAPIDDDSPETLQTRSLLYRAMTRAHMLVLVVNELVCGGFLEYTGRLRLNDSFDAAAERDRMNVDATEEAIRPQKERSDALEQALERCGERAEPAALTLLLGDLDDAKSLSDAAREAVDAWIRQGLAIRQAVGEERAFAAVRLDVAAELRKETDLEAAVASALETWNAQERRRRIHTAVETAGGSRLRCTAALVARLEERVEDEASAHTHVVQLRQQLQRVEDVLFAEVRNQGHPPLAKEHVFHVASASVLKIWEGIKEGAAVRTSFKEWGDEQEEQEAERALQGAMRELRLTTDAVALFRDDVTAEKGTFGRTADAIANVSNHWKETMAEARAALEAIDVEVLATLCCDVAVRMRTMSVSDAATKVLAKWKEEQAATAIVQGVWDASHCSVKQFDGEPRFQPNLLRLGLQQSGEANTLVRFVLETFSSATPEQVHHFLASRDITVTNQSDKDVQLPNINRLDRQVRSAMAGSSTSLQEASRKANLQESCKFYFLDAEAIRQAADTDTFMPLQSVQRRRPEWCVQKTWTLLDACHRRYTEEFLVVAHRWETPDHPDPTGAQWRALREHLLTHRAIRWVWYDFACLPQDIPRGVRTAVESDEFGTMLRNINMLFIGSSGLILMEASFVSRFWPMFESWLLLSSATRDGIQAAKAEERRCTFVCLHSCKIINVGGTVREAKAILANPDISASKSDERVLLERMLQLDWEVRTVMAASTASATHSSDCDFYFLDAETIRTTATDILPRMQDAPAEWLVQKQVTFAQACFGAYKSEYLVVGHRWEERSNPDPDGVQIRALKEHLVSHPHIRWVWYDFACMPMSPRTEGDEVRFMTMLKSVHLLFMGCTGLVLMDASYVSCFWNMHETWLLFSTPTKDGLKKASAAERHVTIVPIHNSNDRLVELLQILWPAGDPTSGSLLVHLSHATNLKAMDRNGFSDPYVKLTLRGQTHKSKTIKKSLNPRWDDHFEFKGVLGELLEQPMQLHAFDNDFGKQDDKLGNASIVLRVFERTRQHDFAVALSDNGGTVNLRMTWVPVGGVARDLALPGPLFT